MAGPSLAPVARTQGFPCVQFHGPREVMPTAKRISGAQFNGKSRSEDFETFNDSAPGTRELKLQLMASMSTRRPAWMETSPRGVDSPSNTLDTLRGCGTWPGPLVADAPVHSHSPSFFPGACARVRLSEREQWRPKLPRRDRRRRDRLPHDDVQPSPCRNSAC
jgi:hypothetical protein